MSDDLLAHDRETVMPAMTPERMRPLTEASDAAEGEAAVSFPDLPEKFRDPDTGSPRLDSLVKSYLALEKKMAGMVAIPGEDADQAQLAVFHRALGVPESHEDYEIRVDEALSESDAAVNQRLHEAGFTPAQAQLVYDLAAERLVPLIEEAAAEFEASRQTEKLESHFGGREKWRETSRQLRLWGQKTLPPQVMEGLSTTYEGVIALHQMMQAEDPPVLRGGGEGDEATPDMLRQMVRDPRYWRDKDPMFIARVSDGFRRFYEAGN